MVTSLLAFYSFDTRNVMVPSGNHSLGFTRLFKASPGSGVPTLGTKTTEFADPKVLVSESTLGVFLMIATSNFLVLGWHGSYWRNNTI